MALETGTYVSDLVETNPLAGDGKSQGDDHIRLIKAVLKATFPNLTGAVNPTQAELNFVDGVTSLIQTQLNTLTSNVALKSNTASPTFTGTVTIPTLDLTNALAIADGGTSATTAAAAFAAIKQAATEAASGVVELDTNTEALAGTDTSRAVTSAGLASGKSLSNPGHYTWPGLFKVNWGITANLGDITAGDHIQDVTFNSPFTTSLYLLIPVAIVSSTGQPSVVVCWDMGASTLSTGRINYAETGSDAQANFYLGYIAIGK